MATKTGNRYTTGTTTDSVEISTWKSGIFDHGEPEPEMAMRPPKPEILISLDL